MMGKSGLIRQDQSAIVAKAEARRLDHLPDVAVGIRKISPVAAVVGLLRPPQHAGACGDLLGESGVDFGRRRAVPGQRRAAKRWLARLRRHDRILGELSPDEDDPEVERYAELCGRVLAAMNAVVEVSNGQICELV